MSEPRHLQFVSRTLVLLALALICSALLTIATYDRLHEQAAVSKFAPTARLLQQELQAVLGRPGIVWRFNDLTAPLQRAEARLRQHPQAGPGVAASLAFADGVMRYSTDSRWIGQRLPEDERWRALEGPGGLRYGRQSGDYALSLPIRDSDGATLATGVLSLDARLVQGDAAARLGQVALNGLLAFTAAALALVLLARRHWPARAERYGPFGNGATWMLILVFCAAQAVALVGNGAVVAQDYLAELQSGRELAAAQLAADMKGADTGAVAAAYDRAVPEARIGADGVVWTASTPWLSLAAEAATLAGIALLLCVELAVLLLNLRPACADQPPPPADYRLMRPAIFLFLFGLDSCMAFLPQHMGRLYEPLFGLSREAMMGLPISVEFICVGLAILWSGAWVDRAGWRQPFRWGLMLAACGGLWSWLATDAIQFIASRGVVGLGYGLTLLAAQGYVIRSTDSRSKARGLAHLFAGLYAGSICGAAAGAMLAERFGYRMVFFIGALLVLTVVAYAWATLWRLPDPTLRPVPAGGPGRMTWVALRGFLLDRRVLAVVLFSSMPASVAAVGFLNYFSPVYLSGLGVSEATIGRVLMLFGLCLSLLGPALGRWADACESKRLPVVCGGLLGGLAFLVFNVLQGVEATALAVVLLGLSNALVLSSQSAYLLRLEATHALGDGKALAIFRATSRIGQMLGPIVFAWVLLSTDIQTGITGFGLAYLGMALLFLVLTHKASGQEALAAEGGK